MENLNENKIVNKDVITIFLQTANESFFDKNYTNLRYTVVGYRFIKEIFNKKQGLVNDSSFKFIFGQFYGMTRLFVSQEFLDEFYIKMEEIQMQEVGKNDVIDVAKTLSEYDRKTKDGKTRFQFSYITKMFNIANDSVYPIYDDQVARVFKFNKGNLYTNTDNPNEHKANIYKNWYKEITDTYNELLTGNNKDKVNEIIECFNNKFDSKDLSPMRILDMIIWQIGDK